VTRDSAAELLGLPMEINPGIIAHLEAYFAKRNKPVNEATKRQAMVPQGARVMDNPFGTAPGLYIPASCGAAKGLHCAMFLLPGPPRELKPMVEVHVERHLEGADAVTCRTARLWYLKVTGMGESTSSDHIEKDLEAMTGLELGYRHRPGRCGCAPLSGHEILVQAAATPGSRSASGTTSPAKTAASSKRSSWTC